MAVVEKRTTSGDVLRTVIVDDSALARLMLRDALSGIEGIRIVGNASEGEAALDVIDETKPGLIILDVEMPGMNGLELLKEMNFRGLETPVLMCSRLTSVGAEVTTEALLQGAYDVVCKPSGSSRQENVRRLRSDLLQKIGPLIHAPEPLPEKVEPSAPSPPAALGDAKVDAVLIGASTGGPAVLHTLLARLEPNLKSPIVIVQHIPVGFSEPLTRRLGQASRLAVVEAEDGTVLEPGTVYVAPGGRHTTIVRLDHGPTIQLTDAPPVNGCRPSVDVMLHSAADVFGKQCLAVILTGMGRDGARGAKTIRGQGGLVFAQHPESCTVSSMPRQTINLAGADRIADIPQLAELINSIAAPR